MQPHPRIPASLEEAAAAFKGETVKSDRKAEPLQRPGIVGITSIKERPIKTRRVAAFTNTGSGFPDVKSILAKASSSKFPSETGSRSIFSSLISGEKVEISKEPKQTSIKEMRASETETELFQRAEVSGEPKSSGIDEVERSRINAENETRIKNMSETEIEEARSELLERFDPNILAKLAATKKRKSTKGKTNVTIKSEPEPSKDLGWIRSESDLRLALETHATRSEKLKVQWMLEEDVSMEKTGNSGAHSDPTLTEPRFDLAGDFVTVDKEFRNELYHHAGPNVPGYTLVELVHLSRSTVSAQRTIALKALAGVFARRSADLSAFVRVEMRHDETLITLRMALDQENTTGLPHAIDALYAFVMPPETFMRHWHAVNGFGMSRYKWGVIPRAQGAPTNPPASAREIVLSREAEKKEEADEESRPSESDLAEASPTRFLIKSRLIARVAFLIVYQELLEASVEKLLEIVSFLILSRPWTAEDEFPYLKDILVSSLNRPGLQTPSLRLLDLMLASNPSIGDLVARETALIEAIKKISVVANLSPYLPGVLCHLMTNNVFDFAKVFPSLASTLDESVERLVINGTSGQSFGETNKAQLETFICGVFDLAKDYCDKCAPSEDRASSARQQLRAFAEMSSRIVGTLFSIIGTKVCSSAVRFLAGYVSLTQRVHDSEAFPWILATSFTSFEQRKPRMHGSADENEETFTIDDMTKEFLFSDEPEIVSRSAPDLDHDLLLDFDFILVPVLLFFGHSLHALETPTQDEYTYLVALDAMLGALMSLLNLCAEPTVLDQILSTSEVLPQLWRVVSKNLVEKSNYFQRPLAKPSLSPQTGLVCLTRDSLFLTAIRLLGVMLMRAETTGVDMMMGNSDEFLPSATALRKLLTTYVANVYGSFGCAVNDSELCDTLIASLATPALMTFPDSRVCLELRDSLLSSFRSASIVRDPSSRIVMGNDMVYKRWTRCGPLWPLVSLVDQPGANEDGPKKILRKDDVLAPLIFAGRLDSADPLAVFAALSVVCIRFQKEALEDPDVTFYANALLDSALCHWPKSAVMLGDSNFLLRLVGSRDKTRQLAGELAQRFVEDSFGHSLLGRVLCFLLSDASPLEARISAMTNLLRGRGLGHLPQTGKTFFNPAIEETDEMVIGLYGQIVEEDPWGEGWFFDYVRVQVTAITNGDQKSRWAAKRLLEKVSLFRPDMVSL